jgi:hypothetical protein
MKKSLLSNILDLSKEEFPLEEMVEFARQERLLSMVVIFFPTY